MRLLGAVAGGISLAQFPDVTPFKMAPAPGCLTAKNIMRQIDEGLDHPIPFQMVAKRLRISESNWTLNRTPATALGRGTFLNDGSAIVRLLD